ncbi:glycoside hydrolase family 99-like domain-containing protein, partial [Aliivibrio kagoshimensis]|uniref:glycoside hydrolase family 99-like domain-containing protein n=1 Tax=Aliivibrio kagoshimensis TaxID=2910230 RepID=UPI003D0DD78E
MLKTDTKTYAFYLPQFHPCNANDEFWEEGFTDWVTTYGAKPLFEHHVQPIASTELGRYNLTDPDVIRKQAQLARDNNVDGFAIYHYWFGKGDRALEEPIEILRKNKDIDIGYYISWVNCNWTKSWVGNDKVIIREQQYDSEFYDELMLDAIEHFKDDRYQKLNGAPFFYIHSPKDFDVKSFMKKFSRLAQEYGFSRIIWLAPEIHVAKSQKVLFDYLLGYPPGDFNTLERKIKFRLWKLIEK